MPQKTWKGKYSYTFDQEGTWFTFGIEAELNDGSFVGYATEEEFSKVSSDRITVKGFIESDMISFVKTYPYFYAVDENGNNFIDKTRKGHEVIYEGYFDEKRGTWSGEWEIRDSEEEVAPGQWKTLSIIGPWEMNSKLEEDQ